MEWTEVVIEAVGSAMGREQASEIAGWVQDKEEARNWAGSGKGFPVGEDVVLGWQEDLDVHGFVGGKEGELVAYGEVWVDRDEGEIELARIIVKPKVRGKGVGRAFVLELVNRAAGFGLPDLILRVVPGNLGAIRCYRGAGFEEFPAAERDDFNKGQPVEYVWLQYPR